MLNHQLDAKNSNNRIPLILHQISKVLSTKIKKRNWNKNIKIQHVDEQQKVIHDRVWVCSWHYKGQILATAGEDRTIKVIHSIIH